MIPESLRPLAVAAYDDRDLRFWICQLTGWFGYSLATFLSITVLDNNVSMPHVTHIVIQALLGVLCSWPMRWVYRGSAAWPLQYRALVALLAVVFFSGLWTTARLYTFSVIGGDSSLWREFNYWFFGSLFVFLSWTVLYFAINFYELLAIEHRKLLQQSALNEQERARRLEAESLARDAQLQMLRYQLNPHFLFNTLNAINALVTLGETSQAKQMIGLLSQFLRHTLEQQGIENVSLDQELATLERYLAIEQVRFNDRLKLEFDIEARARQALVPILILQPIVENAMKYAIAPSEEGGTVTVRAAVVEGELKLEVSDTGPGIEGIQSDTGRGVGLRNTLERLGTLYGSDCRFSADNVEPSGLSVRLSIPFEAKALEGPIGAVH
jgi:sensor histidine kinase YesM